MLHSYLTNEYTTVSNLQEKFKVWFMMVFVFFGSFLANMERSNLYLKLFKLVFGSVSLFASENEQMLKVG